MDKYVRCIIKTFSTEHEYGNKRGNNLFASYATKVTTSS